MRPDNALRKVLLALSIAVLFAGATCLSDGMCGGGGGGGYRSSPSIAGK